MESVPSYNEREILMEVAAGDPSAFTRLFRKYSKLLYSFLYEHIDSPELADDLVQDIFTKIWLTREALTEVRSFHSYLYTIARNHVFNHIKKLIRERERQKIWADSNADSFGMEEKNLWENRLDIIEQAVGNLPAQQQKVWVMSRHKKMKYQQIADELQLSVETVKKYLGYAKESIVKYVTTHGDLVTLLFFLKIFCPE